MFKSTYLRAFLHINAHSLLGEGCYFKSRNGTKSAVALYHLRLDLGDVQFVSYLSTYETLWEDVSFVLVKDNQIIYYFPECYENNSTENDSVGMFDSVEAVGFQDIDGDGAKDVIVIINYVTGAGPQGMMPRKTIRIFSSQDNGFVIQHDLMDELN